MQEQTFQEGSESGASPDTVRQGDWPALNCLEVIGGSPAVPILLGSRCTACGEWYFPKVAGCTRCCARDLQSVELGSRGVLWSWTVQMFRPKAPYDGGGPGDAFVPYGVGYVEMPCGLKVESRLVAEDLEALRIGQPMRLLLEPYRVGPDGNATHTFAFTPEPA